MSAPVLLISRHAILRRLWRMEDEIKALKAENARLTKAVILSEIEAASFPPIAPVLAAMVAGRQASTA